MLLQSMMQLSVRLASQCATGFFASYFVELDLRHRASAPSAETTAGKGNPA